MKPLVSFIMPMRNSAATLTDTLDSILGQTYREWELWCLNDGSDDATAEIIDRYAKRESRIRVMHFAPRGIVPTLNDGVHAAQGTLIARMDADDLAMPERLEVQVALLSRHPDWAGLGSAYQVISAQGEPWKTVHPPTSPELVRQSLQKSNCLCHPSMLLRATAIRRMAGPYREPFLLAEDYDLWLRMTEQFQIGNAPQVLLRYRSDPSRTRSERIVTGVLSCLAAQQSARFRAAGLQDPGDDWSRIDREILHRAGLEDDQINYQLRRVLLAEARVAARRNLPQIAQHLAQTAEQFAPRRANVLHLLDYYWRQWKVSAA